MSEERSRERGRSLSDLSAEQQKVLLSYLERVNNSTVYDAYQSSPMDKIDFSTNKLGYKPEVSSGFK